MTQLKRKVTDAKMNQQYFFIKMAQLNTQSFLDEKHRQAECLRPYGF